MVIYRGLECGAKSIMASLSSIARHCQFKHMVCFHTNIIYTDLTSQCDIEFFFYPLEVEEKYIHFASNS